MEQIVRYNSTDQGQIAYEHLHRYAFAAQYVARLDIVDIASGEGYGSSILARSARSVVGIDIDAATVDAAARRYRAQSNLNFRTGDVAAIPLDSSSVDVVVSFETIEHCDNPEKLIQEARRILRPDGLLILSSPNKVVYNRGRREPNEYHIAEMTLEECRELLRKYFKVVEAVGQQMTVISMTSPLDVFANGDEYRGYIGHPRAGSQVAEIHAGLSTMSDPEYFLFLCSDLSIVHPAATHSILVNPDDNLWIEHNHKLLWASTLHDEHEELRKRIDEANEAVQRVGAELVRAESDRAVATIKGESLERLAQNLNDRLADLAGERDRLVRMLNDGRPGGMQIPEARDEIIGYELRAIVPLLAQLGSVDGPASLSTLVHVLSRAAIDQAVNKQQLEAAYDQLAATRAEAERVAAHHARATGEQVARVHELASDRDAVAAMVKERDDLLRELAGERDAVAAMAEERERRLGELAGERDAIAAAVEERDARLLELTGERDAMATAINERDLKLEQLRNDREAMIERLRDLTAAAGRADALQTDLLAARQDENEARSILATERLAARAAIDNIWSERESFRVARDNLRSEYRSACEQLDGMRQRVEDAEMAAADRSALERQVQRAIDDAAGAIAHRDAAIVRATDATDRLDSATRQLQESAQRIKRLEEEVANHRSRAGHQHAAEWEWRTRVAQQEAELVGRERAASMLTAITGLLSLAGDTGRAALDSSRAILPQLQNAMTPVAAFSTPTMTLRKRDREPLVAAGLFDPEWYAVSYSIDGVDPFLHYIANGLGQGLTPGPLVDERWLASQLGSHRAIPGWLKAAERGSIAPTPLFDAAYYRQWMGEAIASETPWQHFRRVGWSFDRPICSLFDRNWIASTWPTELVETFSLEAFLSDPRFFPLSPHPLFNSAAYLGRYGDVAAAGISPLAHYVARGWREGRLPNRLFDGCWYLAQNNDVLAAGMCPLVHYVQYGADEKRLPHPLFDPVFYEQRYSDVGAAGVEGFAHFVRTGFAEGRIPHAAIRDIIEIAQPDSEEVRELVRVAFGEATPTPPRRQHDGIAKQQSNISLPALVPADEYWLSQQLRDYIIDRYGEGAIALYVYLFSVIDRYADDPGQFDTSAACQTLARRIAGRLSLADQAPPLVSIVIPVYNNLLYTLTCIASIIETQPAISFEILVGDDCSTDTTAEVISSLGTWIRLIRNDSNLGFLQNCNETSKNALGDYIILLNNDTLVLPTWLDSLVQPLIESDRIGVIGSKLLNGDGTLQEAGGIIWSDGSGWNFGRNQNPRLPEFNYRKDVDYCSGAAIALRTTVWRALGGFDARYAPAYYEDTDLAFRVREHGLRSVYAPHSELIHHEGRSHGRDVSSGIKAYQLVNAAKFMERWGGVIGREHFPNAEHVTLARDRSRSKPHMLIIDHYVPQWDRDAGSRSMYHYMRLLAVRGFHVTFWPDNLNEDREYTRHLQELGIEVIFSHHYAGKFEEWLAANGEEYRYALFSRPHITKNYIDAVERRPWIKRIYYGHDLHYLRLHKQIAILGEDAKMQAEAAMWEELEREICRRSHVVLYPGAEEVEIVRGWVNPGTVVVTFPIWVFSEDEIADGRRRIAADAEDPFALMFVGGFNHQPNVDAITWFVERVFPLLRQYDSRYRLEIAGSNAPPRIRSLAGEGIVVLDRVSDVELDQLYGRSGMAVVPLLYGGGVKGKVIEAMTRGIPLAMTSTGGQGIEAAGECAIVEDDVDVMARAIVDAGLDRSQTRMRALRAIEFIEGAYSTGAVAALLATFIPEIALNGEPGSMPK